MLIAITGTPGTGKTSVTKILEKNGFSVIYLNELVIEKSFILGKDEKRNSNIVDIEKTDEYFKKHKTNDLVFIDGHLSHLFSNVDKVIILRCHPNKLEENLNIKNWKKEKINENIESEILDIILTEAVDIHKKENIFEIDTTDLSINGIYNAIYNILKNNFKDIKKYKIGKIDWSEEILNRF